MRPWYAAVPSTSSRAGQCGLDRSVLIDEVGRTPDPHAERPVDAVSPSGLICKTTSTISRSR